MCMCDVCKRKIETDEMYHRTVDRKTTFCWACGNMLCAAASAKDVADGICCSCCGKKLEPAEFYFGLDQVYCDNCVKTDW